MIKNMYRVETSLKIMEFLVNEKIINKGQDYLDFLNDLMELGEKHRKTVYEKELEEYRNLQGETNE